MVALLLILVRAIPFAIGMLEIAMRIIPGFEEAWNRLIHEDREITWEDFRDLKNSLKPLEVIEAEVQANLKAEKVSIEMDPAEILDLVRWSITIFQIAMRLIPSFFEMINRWIRPSQKITWEDFAALKASLKPLDEIEAEVREIVGMA